MRTDTDLQLLLSRAKDYLARHGADSGLLDRAVRVAKEKMIEADLASRVHGLTLEELNRLQEMLTPSSASQQSETGVEAPAGEVNAEGGSDQEFGSGGAVPIQPNSILLGQEVSHAVAEAAAAEEGDGPEVTVRTNELSLPSRYEQVRGPGGKMRWRDRETRKWVKESEVPR